MRNDFETTDDLGCGYKILQNEIKLVDIMAANNSSEINAQDISTTITVGTNGGSSANPSQGNTTNTPGLNITVTPGTTNTPNTNTNVNVNTNNNANTNKANTTNTNKNTNKVNTNTNSLSSYVNGYNSNSVDDIPYTGVEDTVMYLMIGVMIIAIISYVKFERVNKEIK